MIYISILYLAYPYVNERYLFYLNKKDILFFWNRTI